MPKKIGISSRTISLFVVVLTWLLFTLVFFRGYVGVDDLIYARYAHEFDRPPGNHWEFRIPSILAIRASFALLGSTELAAALPSLLSSLGILVSVAWFVGWPRSITVSAQAAVLLAATFPHDVSNRSMPGATTMATGCLAVGTVCFLKGNPRSKLLGALLFAVGFMAHEIVFFYIAILCITSCVFDWKRYLRPTCACVFFSAASMGLEFLTYSIILDDPFARLRSSGSTTETLVAGFDPDNGIGGVRFFAWPVIENLVFSRSFGLYLLLLFATGAMAWRLLKSEQRILLLTIFFTWVWLGYGTQVPWAYKPLYRQLHYYGFVTFGVAALLPTTFGIVFSNHRKTASFVLSAAVFVHLLSFAFCGRWGQDVDVSRDLLDYAARHPSDVFIVDVSTMNDIYVLGGFRVPKNVVCFSGPGIRSQSMINDDTVKVKDVSSAGQIADRVLINLEKIYQRGVEPKFLQMLEMQPNRETIVARKYRPAFRPWIAHLPARDFMVLSLGGELAPLNEPAGSLHRDQ